MAWPIPESAPVTRACFPCSFIAISCSMGGARRRARNRCAFSVPAALAASTSAGGLWDGCRAGRPRHFSSLAVRLRAGRLAAASAPVRGPGMSDARERGACLGRRQALHSHHHSLEGIHGRHDPIDRHRALSRPRDPRSRHA
ncbi:hypothetical protein BGLA2_1810015 [Burkholderia gladioli]|nr:hypothetical protein BGLA2_1810015 [Burkholderia gladioli]